MYKWYIYSPWNLFEGKRNPILSYEQEVGIQDSTCIIQNLGAEYHKTLIGMSSAQEFR